MRILLFGGSGQVGRELQRALSLLGEVIAPGRNSADPIAADFARPESLAATVRAVAPDVIVNAAAHTAVDRCESEPELAHAINAAAPAVLAAAACEGGVPLVHYSTDYVFDGSGTTAWQEDDATGPLNVYGASKLAGEKAIRSSGCAHLIVRTGWVHAPHGANFVRTMLRLAEQRDTVSVVADQIGAPTPAALIADATAHMLRALAADASLAGTYHVAAAGECSWHAVARHVVAFARANGRPVRVADGAIRALASADYPTPARRPLNSRLDTRRFRSAFGLLPPPWQAGVERTLADLIEPS